MDPPYSLISLDGVLDRLVASELLERGSTVVVGHSKRLSLKPSYQDLALERNYRYGDSQVDFFQSGDR